MKHPKKRIKRFSSHSQRPYKLSRRISVLRLTYEDIFPVNANKQNLMGYYKFSPQSIRQLKSWFLRKAKTTQTSQISSRWTFKDFRSAINSQNNHIFCALSYGASNILCLEGFVIYQIMQDEAEILFLLVKGNSRRKGIGRFLLNLSLNDLARSNIKSVFLEVAKTNRSAIQLYRKQNFKVIGSRKNYYAFSRVKKVDALTMQCSLFITH